MENPILRSVIEMTRQKELDALECSLVITLAELIGTETISLYKVVDKDNLETLEEIVNLDNRKGDGKISCSWDADRRMVKADTHLLKCLWEKKAIECKMSETHTRFLMPIELSGNLYGALAMYGEKDWLAYQALIQGFIKIYTNNLTILEESERDKLTGLLNRRTFDSKINKLLQKQKEHLEEYKNQNGDERRKPSDKAVAWLAMLDIDHFKRINDTYGHLYGDEVILTLSQIMQSVFRDSDLLFRFGGEEFLVVFEPMEKGMVYEVMERFRKSVAGYQFAQIDQLTVSIGFTQIKNSDYPPTVLDNADKALYYAKENGRNCIYNYEDLITEGKLVEQRKHGDIDLF